MAWQTPHLARPWPACSKTVLCSYWQSGTRWQSSVSLSSVHDGARMPPSRASRWDGLHLRPCSGHANARTHREGQKPLLCLVQLTCHPSTSLLRPGQCPTPRCPDGPVCCCGVALPGPCWSAACPALPAPPAPFLLPPSLAAEPLCRCVPGPKAGKSASVSMLSGTGAAGAAVARLASCAAFASSVRAAGAPLLPGAPVPGGRECSSVTVRGSS